MKAIKHELQQLKDMFGGAASEFMVTLLLLGPILVVIGAVGLWMNP